MKPLEPVELKEGEEVLIWIESSKNRREAAEEFHGKRGSAPKELLNEFMLEAETQ